MSVVMATVIYDGDADLRYGTSQIPKGQPFEVEDGDVQSLIDRYGLRLAGAWDAQDERPTTKQKKR